MNRSAFTFIELLIVIAIVAILTTIAIPNLMNAQMRAKISRTQTEQLSLSIALEKYFLDWKTFMEDHDYPSDRSKRGLFRLTSPTLYMSSLPREEFPSSNKSAAEGYTYFEFRSGNTSIPGKDWPATAYLIISPGPNLVEDVSGNDGFPFGTIIRRYDVSNGLNSDGDIVRMGGQYLEGIIIVDGQYIYRGSSSNI